MELIDRQAAIEIVDRYDKSHMILKGKPMLGAASIVIELEDLPSAQPEIIRCKDCKHYTEPNIEYCELYGAMILWGKDDFCSRGERRTDE